jgi:FkbM family methyltransferase
MTRNIPRDILYRIEAVFGTAAGFLCKLLPAAGRPLYRALVKANRFLPDRAALYIFPFVTAWGTAQFDLGKPALETLVLPNGALLPLDISEKTQRQVFSHKVFEAGLSRFLLKMLHEGDAFVDVGSNVGYFALLASGAVGKTGTVLALEPEKKNFQVLQEAAAQNHLSQIRPIQAAAAEKDGGIMTLHVNPLNRGGNSMLPFSAYASGAHTESKESIREKFTGDDLSQEVPVRTLDSLCAEYGLERIALMKIDVEGFEWSVLQGSRGIFEKRIPENVVCEVNNQDTKNQVLEFFSSYGYVPFLIGFNGSLSRFPENQPVHGNILFVSGAG